MLNQLKSSLKREINKEMIKDQDPFYQLTKVEPKVSFNPQNKQYLVEISLPKHERESVNLTAYDREIKISMDRDFSFDKTNKKGTRNSLKRIESITSKIPVEHILDSKSIQKKITAEGIRVPLRLHWPSFDC